MQYIYLHGFASSPNSAKARDIQSYLANLHVNIKIPDLNNGDFSHLTITRQLKQVEKEFPRDSTPVTLIGSSLGGLTAAFLAENHISVQRLILLAPAFGFLSHWTHALGEEKLQRWRQDQYIMVYHYGETRSLPLHYDFITDAALYLEDKLRRPIPTLILHGINDEVIPIQASRDFAQQRHTVELVELNTDHAMYDVIDNIKEEISRFCRLQ
ncbi:hypothetical protein RIVM261_029580 [Rivularia sp. IAM M-261]|nr:hypothetical protein CAL7716_011080 [Calothrix sp. PCC 7716]GJD18002.1 hypothetical protein RIVM261_029580 [Rivularia sp. IAM M-261]